VELTIVGEKGTESLCFTVQRMINGGFTGRDSASVQAHIAELAAEGVAPPPAVPVLYPVVRHNLTTGDQVQVAGKRTSGEAEYVLFLDEEEVYVSVGSDHTDRALEAYGVLESKQVCLNVCSKQAWRFGDVDDRWDELVLRSWVTPSVGADEVLYQDGVLGALLPPDDLIMRVLSAPGVSDRDGLVIFGGTIPLIAGETICGSAFRCELEDPLSGRKLESRYDVTVLEDPNAIKG